LRMYTRGLFDNTVHRPDLRTTKLCCADGTRTQAHPVREETSVVTVGGEQWQASSKASVCST
jgi:hypothetical protein